MNKIKSTILLSLVLFVYCGSGNPEPVPIYFGEDACGHCQMIISEPNFAAQYLPQKGKAKKFDDVGCLLARLQSQPEKLRAIFVASFEDGNWLDAEKAIFLKSEKINTPMSFGLAAFPNPAAAQKMQEQFGGEILRFEEMKQK
jgi:copper chaperone NosL